MSLTVPGLDAFLEQYPANPMSVPEQARLQLCRQFWMQIDDSSRAAVLIEVLDGYRSCHQNSVEFKGDTVRESFALNELTRACYKAGVSTTEEQSLEILRTAFHGCAHRDDVVPPVDLALRHFRSQPYSQDFFDALRAYRVGLGRSYAVAQNLKGRLDLILWQDLDHPLPMVNCWTSRIRTDVRDMEPNEQLRWRASFQAMHIHQASFPKRWEPGARRALEGLTVKAFAFRMHGWLKDVCSAARPELSGAGSHVLKNLIWYAILADSSDLDAALPDLEWVEWKKAANADKLSGALDFLRACRRR